MTAASWGAVTADMTIVPCAASLILADPQDLRDAADVALGEADARVKAILDTVANGDNAARVLDDYDEALAGLANLRAMAKAIVAVHPDPVHRENAAAVEEMVAAATTRIELGADVLDVLLTARDGVEDEQVKRWVGREIHRMRSAGADLDETSRRHIIALKARILRLEQDFERTVAQERLSIRLPGEALHGLSEEYQKAHPAGQDGLVEISTDRSDLMPFLAHAHDGQAREALWRTSRRRCQANNAILRELLSARHELATRLGHASWAHFVLADTMAGTPEDVDLILGRLQEAARPAAEREYAMLLRLKRDEDPAAEAVEPWDMSYLMDKAKAALAADLRSTHRYFEFPRVLNDAMDLLGELFEVRFQLVESRVWHPDVLVYDVAEAGSTLGRIYLDLHTRPGKRVGASMFELVIGKDGRRLPQCLAMANLPPLGDSPIRLSFPELVMLLHEFGHALHHLVSGHGRWSVVSGLSMERDFVEVPAQILEEWVRDPQTLVRLGEDADTGDRMDLATARRLAGGDAVGRAMTEAQHAFYAQLSLDLHTVAPNRLDPLEVEVKAMTQHTLLRPASEAPHFWTFGHLVGYSATYYTYLWSRIIAKDIYSAMAVGSAAESAAAFRRYRGQVLGPGGSSPAKAMVETFLRRPVSFEPYARWLDGS